MEVFFFFSRKLSSSAVELESVEFSSSTTLPLPEKPPLSAATRMFPAFFRRSTEDEDVSGGRGRVRASVTGDVSDIGLAALLESAEDSDCNAGSEQVEILRGSDKLSGTLFSHCVLLGLARDTGSGGLQ